MKISSSSNKKLNGKPFKIAIILALFNDSLGNELLKNTQKRLQELGVAGKNIRIIKVPGALEIPLAAKILGQQKKFNAIIALGVVIKGETAHFEYVCGECYRGLMDVNLQTLTPIIFGVLTCFSLKEAKERAAANGLNKGKEYAEAAIEMATLTKLL